MKSAAVILAAGKSSRFGQPKALLEWQGEPLLQRSQCIAKESGHDLIFVVVAPQGPITSAHLADNVILLPNERHQEGMGTSLALAATELLSREIASLTILLPDQAAVTAQNLLELRENFSPPEVTIVLAQSEKHSGPPAIFAREHFLALSKLTGDEGGKKIVQAHPSQTRTIAIPEARWDIDTPEIWQEFTSRKADHPR